MASVPDTFELLEDITNFLGLEENPYFFKLKDELQTFPDNMISRITQKLNEIVEDEPFKFKTTILNLILIHEYTEAKNRSSALKVIENIDQEINVLMKDRCEHLLFNKIALVLRNIITTYKICIASTNDVEKAHKMLRDVVPLSDLKNENKAAIYGIRASILMEYGLYGNKSALVYAKKAKDTDPGNAWWFFLIGKCLGRIRRVEKPFDIPSNEERVVLKQAIKMEENYLFTLFTAEVYAETANRTFKFHSRNGTLYPHLKFSIDQLNEEASAFYRKSIEKQPDCTHVLFRAAKGFMALPYPQKDVNYAKDLLLKGLKIAPQNPFGNHILAKYYERYDKNMELAMKHLKICTQQNVFGAHMDMLKIEHQQNQANMDEKLTDLLTVYPETPRRLQILTQLASYYVFVNPNLVKACELMKECVEMNYDDNILNHRSLFVQQKEPFSLIDVLIDEIKIEMQNKCSPERSSAYKEFLNNMTESNIILPKGRAKNLKNEILLEEQELKSKYSQAKGCRKTNKQIKNFNHPKSSNSHRQDTSYGRLVQQPLRRAKSSNIRNEERVDAVKKTCNFFDAWKQDVRSSEDNSEGRSSQSDISTKKPGEKPISITKQTQSENSSASKSHFGCSTSNSVYDRSYKHPFQPNRFNEKMNGEKKVNCLNKSENIDADFDRLKISSKAASGAQIDNASRSSLNTEYKNQKSLDLESDTDDDLMSFLRDKK